MIKKIKQLITLWRYERAVAKANKLSQTFKRKYLVINVGGSIKVIAKSRLSKLVKQRYFKKGVTLQALEKKVLYSTI